MATVPRDQIDGRPDRYGRIRTSRADREQVIDTLKAAFVQDRLTKDELDGGTTRALVPLTYAELASLTDDLPAGLTPVCPAAAEQPRQGRRVRDRRGRLVRDRRDQQRQLEPAHDARYRLFL